MKSFLTAPGLPEGRAVALAGNARWIWAPEAGEPNTYLEFSGEFDWRPAGADLELEAWIQLSAETSLRLWVNGELRHTGPLREVPPYFYFDTIDLLPYLQCGKNELRIVAHHQGADSQSYQAGTPAILVAGHCRIGSDPGIDFSRLAWWRVRRITAYRKEAQRLFCCLGFAEYVDWEQKEDDWKTPIDVSYHLSAARPQALARDLPPFRETRKVPLTRVQAEDGWMIDMGMEVSGYVHLILQSAQPVTLRVTYGEDLEGGRCNPGKGGMDYFDRLELGTKRIEWRSYEKRAFRFIHLNAPVSLVEVGVIEQSFPYEPIYRSTPDYGRRAETEQGRLINRILEVSARTIELNSEDLLTDCPWRERAQYLDSYFYMGAMQKLFGTLEPFRRFLHQFPRGADATGLLRACYPSPASTLIIPDFSISYAFLLQQYLERSGDLETVRKNLSQAERGIAALGAHEDSENLLSNVPGWIFLDNTFELPKYPRSAGLNAVYYGGHTALAALFRVCGEPERAAFYEVKAGRLRESFRRMFVSKDRVLDADSTPEHESFRQWVYHYSAETGHWKGRSFRLQISFRRPTVQHPLRLSVHAGGRAWIDGVLVADIKEGGSWTRSAVYEGTELAVPADGDWHVLDVEVEWSGIDWECYLSSRGEVEWAPATVWEEVDYGKCQAEALPPASSFQTSLRRHQWPWMSQITVGYAALHGLLETDEAKRFLGECLPRDYSFPYAKRTTPFFGVIHERTEERRILPCNVPASMFYFCHALKKYGMAAQARALLLPIYEGMLERGATTWWEEWNTRSSLCHAWASFVVDFMEDD